MNFKKSFSICLSTFLIFSTVSLRAMDPPTQHIKNNSMARSYFDEVGLINNENRSLSPSEILNNGFWQDIETESFEEGKCPICTEDMDIKKGDVIKLNCGHIFHMGCMIFSRRFRVERCPLCRETIKYASKCNSDQFAANREKNDDSESSKTILENDEEYVPYCEGLMKCIIF